MYVFYFLLYIFFFYCVTDMQDKQEVCHFRVLVEQS